MRVHSPNIAGARIARPLTYGVVDDGVSLQNRIIQEDAEAARVYLRHVARSAPMADLASDIIVEVGAPANAILDAAERRGADLIVITSHGRTGLGRWVLGSVAEHVVHHAQAPVLLLRSGTDEAVGPAQSALKHSLRVLVPLDGSPLAEAILAPVRALAQALATAGPVVIHLTIVIPPYDADRANMPDRLLWTARRPT